jgi:hypothetical protein
MTSQSGQTIIQSSKSQQILQTVIIKTEHENLVKYYENTQLNVRT